MLAAIKRSIKQERVERFGLLESQVSHLKILISEHKKKGYGFHSSSFERHIIAELDGTQRSIKPAEHLVKNRPNQW